MTSKWADLAAATTLAAVAFTAAPASAHHAIGAIVDTN
jgi:hypothetical protein